MKIKKHIDSSLSESEVIIHAKTTQEADLIAQKLTAQLSIVTPNGLFFLTLSEILCLMSQRNYVEIATITGEHIQVRGTLKDFELRLGSDFVRISRSTIINFEHLQSLDTSLIHGIVAKVSGQNYTVSQSGYQALLTHLARKEREYAHHD